MDTGGHAAFQIVRAAKPVGDTAVTSTPAQPGVAVHVPPEALLPRGGLHVALGAGIAQLRAERGGAWGKARAPHPPASRVQQAQRPPKREERRAKKG